MADEHGDARAAGIYSYEKLVTAYPEYYDPVANTLLAFIVARGPAKQTFEDGARPERIGADVNAAAYVLGTMPLPQNAKFWIFNYYLVGADFSNREAFRGAQFLGTTLYAAKFVYANLTGAVFRRAHLEDWIAYGSAKWDKRMKPARDPNDGWWSWERYRYIVNFDSANLKGAHFEHTSVAGASFRGADLTGVEFSGTDVSRADFRDELGRPNASLTDEQFKDACYGRDEVGRPPTQPLGLPKTIMEKLRPCG